MFTMLSEEEKDEDIEADVQPDTASDMKNIPQTMDTAHCMYVAIILYSYTGLCSTKGDTIIIKQLNTVQRCKRHYRKHNERH
ncbi:hypothetical protein FKM82_019481 [Ascaphus truei]